MVDETDLKETKGKVVIARVADSVAESLDFWSRKKNVPKGRLIENSLVEYISKLEHTLDYLMELVSNAPLLALQKDIIEKVFKGQYHQGTIAEVVEIIKKGNTEVYDIGYKEIVSVIKNLKTQKIKEMLIVLRVDPSSTPASELQPIVSEVQKVGKELAFTTSFEIIFEPELKKEGARALLFLRSNKNGEDSK